jgi:hypothetical protein
MATNPKILKLIQSLHQATASGRLQWSESGITDYFHLDLKQGGITVTGDSEDGREEYFVSLRGEKGGVIQSEFFVQGDEGFDAARNLFQMVKRKSLHVDSFIDSVISELDKIP